MESMSLNYMKKNKDKLTILFVGIVIGWIFFSGGQWFNDRYKFYCPMIISRSTVCSIPHQINQEASGSATLTPTTSQIDYDEIFDKIWLLETSRGKAITGWHLQCREINKWNEIGVAPFKKCFNNKQEGRDFITNYFSTRLNNGWSIAEILCYFNTGIKQSSCSYYKKYINL